MPDRTNRQFRLAARPAGLPKPTDWELTTESVPAPREGEVLIQVLYVSIDPAMRHWMNEGRSYTEPVQIGDVMRAGTVGFTTKMMLLVARAPTPEKSRTGSNGSFAEMLALTGNEEETASSV